MKKLERELLCYLNTFDEYLNNLMFETIANIEKELADIHRMRLIVSKEIKKAKETLDCLIACSKEDDNNDYRVVQCSPKS